MWEKIYRKIIYIIIMLSLAACGSLEGIGKGIGGAFKGFGKFLP